ncbi:IS3 family transposase [Streptomyces sp. CA-294286]|uniref:IS3 family transposase n=1 Tax=Streptomyces sp. CA-294286 TaxID=3240070 RepID=UPI003D8DDDDD
MAIQAFIGASSCGVEAELKRLRKLTVVVVRGAQAREQRRRVDEALVHEITVTHLASRRTYGVLRVTAALCRQGNAVNHKRVELVMGEHGIAGRTRRTGRRSLTKQDSRSAPALDLLGRGVHVESPGRKIVGDITYTPTAVGWLYLADWLDPATRELVGYSMPNNHRADLVVDMAVGLGRLEPGCVIHSNRGSEYTSSQLVTDRRVGAQTKRGVNGNLLRQRPVRELLGRP